MDLRRLLYFWRTIRLRAAFRGDAQAPHPLEERKHVVVHVRESRRCFRSYCTQVPFNRSTARRFEVEQKGATRRIEPVARVRTAVQWAVFEGDPGEGRRDLLVDVEEELPVLLCERDQQTSLRQEPLGVLEFNRERREVQRVVEESLVDDGQCDSPGGVHTRIGSCLGVEVPERDHEVAEPMWPGRDPGGWPDDRSAFRCQVLGNREFSLERLQRDWPEVTRSDLRHQRSRHQVNDGVVGVLEDLGTASLDAKAARDFCRSSQRIPASP